MTLKQIEKLSKCQYGKHFLTRSYSIELLIYLLEFNQVEGIDDFLFKLYSAKPKLQHFCHISAYLNLGDAFTKSKVPANVANAH